MKEISFKNSYGDTLKGLSWETDKADKNILIITGMQEHAIRYNDFALFLNTNKFNVYCLDHYGQGLNIVDINLPGVWPKDGFNKSIDTFKEYIDELSKAKITYLFGHSMGSFMTQRIISKYPNLVNKVVICGTDFPSPFLMRFAHRVSRLLVNKKNFNETSSKIHKLVTGPFSNAVKNKKTDFDWLSINEDNVNNYINDSKCGYVSTNGFYQEFLKGMRIVGKKKIMSKINKEIHILIIAGEDDPVGHFGKGPSKLFKIYNLLEIKDVHLKLYKGLRHEILNEKEKDVIYNDILTFLNK